MIIQYIGINDNVKRAEGFAVHRFSEQQIEEEPGRVIEDVARALTQEDWLIER